MFLVLSAGNLHWFLGLPIVASLTHTHTLSYSLTFVVMFSICLFGHVHARHCVCVCCTSTESTCIECCFLVLHLLFHFVHFIVNRCVDETELESERKSMAPKRGASFNDTEHELQQGGKCNINCPCCPSSSSTTTTTSSSSSLSSSSYTS